MNEFFLCNKDISKFYVGSNAFCGECKNKTDYIDLTDYTDQYSIKNYEKKFLDFVIFCKTNNLSQYNPNFPSINLITSNFFENSGYSLMSRMLINNLIKFGTNVKLYTNISKIDIDIKEAQSFAQLTHSDIPKESICLYVTTQCKRNKNYTIHYTMSEYEDCPNQYHSKILSYSDELWVPSEWDKQKLDINNKLIKVFPLGVDSDFFDPSNRGNVQFSSGLNKFVFLCIGMHTWRKGFDVVLKAYSKAFSSNDDVTLLILTRGFDVLGDLYEDLKERYLSLIKSDCAHIVFCSSNIIGKVMPYVYNTCNAFVLFSRGEGWGLPYIEAAACGLPVIGTYHGGQKMFLREDESFLIRPDVKSVVPQKENVIDMYRGFHFADFSNKVIDEAAEKMRYVYDHYDKAKELAERARQRITKEFTWGKTAQLVYNRILELQ